MLALAAGPPSPGSARQIHLGLDQSAGGPLASETTHPSSMAKQALRRQTPKVGAVCGSSARTALCGGRSVMGVPTAIPNSPILGIEGGLRLQRRMEIEGGWRVAALMSCPFFLDKNRNGYIKFRRPASRGPLCPQMLLVPSAITAISEKSNRAIPSRSHATSN